MQPTTALNTEGAAIYNDSVIKLRQPGDIESRFLRSPFIAQETHIPDDNEAFYQTELLGLQEDSGAKMKFNTKTLSVLVIDERYLP